MRIVAIGCAAMAGTAAMFYFLIGADAIHTGSISAGQLSVPIAFLAGAAYMVGGALAPMKKRRLLIAGAVLNLLSLVMFVAMYQEHPDVLLSLPNIGTKIPQVFLQFGLVYLIVHLGAKDEEVTVTSSAIPALASSRVINVTSICSCRPLSDRIRRHFLSEWESPKNS
jgi:hypothetical protein